MTSTARAVSTSDAPSPVATDTSVRSTKAPARRALRFGGWVNLVIAAAHTIGLLWAWSMFRAVGIEGDMRELATQGAALPYVLTLVTAAAFLVFGLYALSGAGDLRRLPLLRTGLVVIAVIYLWRATWVIGAISAGDGAQVAFAAIALLVGLCYAAGAFRPAARQRPRRAGASA
jgi:hypothetical protein